MKCQQKSCTGFIVHLEKAAVSIRGHHIGQKFARTITLIFAATQPVVICDGGVNAHSAKTNLFNTKSRAGSRNAA
jgi:TPP-dependent trihydroxycyclohexane-1,2-dione (THcHDO) dehydratase